MEQGNDQLATLLFQISSPAHIPWGDQRWQELLHGYDVWVHIEDRNTLVDQACESMKKHAELSSNLACLSLHVTRLLRDLIRDIHTIQSEPVDTPPSSNGMNSDEVKVANFSKRISIVAKARATAGALQLLRLLCHPVIVEASKNPVTSTNFLKEVFTYRTRGDLARDQQAGIPLIHSLLDFIVVLEARTLTSTTSRMGLNIDVLGIPEIYDAAIFSFQLFFVLCGTQLYQPFYSSFENSSRCHFFLDEVFDDVGNEDKHFDDHNSGFFGSTRSVGSSTNRNENTPRSKRKHRQKQKRNQHDRWKIWTPKSILKTCLKWQIHRPLAPERSISHSNYVLAQSVVHAQGVEKPGPDGLYENHLIVQATSPNGDYLSPSSNTNGNHFNQVSGNQSDDKTMHILENDSTNTKRKSLIVDTTKGILTFSGSIISLPFRLLSLVYGVLTANNKNKSHDLEKAMAMRRLTTSKYSRTRDVLWLSDSLLADLSCSMLLIFASNNRNEKKINKFRIELAELEDNRWDHGNNGPTLPDLPKFKSDKTKDESHHNIESRIDDQNQKCPLLTDDVENQLTLNFEDLFESFRRTLHNELGALLLYTIIQSSPSFAKSLAVRSDMDNIVMPLLRTLYFAFRSNTYMAKDYGKKIPRRNDKSGSETTILDIRDCPFRSQSQLYVIVILLLLLSQDSSFGREVFRRITVDAIPWYKERNLKNVNLGSVIILTFLRSLLFNLNRLSDDFLLNNCCAVLENISPSIVDIHEYAAMRLVSVTVLVMKKHTKLMAGSSKSKDQLRKRKDSIQKNQPSIEDAVDMYAEVISTLLGMIKNGLSLKNIDGNIHLIYALVYHQTDFVMLCKTKYSVGTNNGSSVKKKLYSSKQTARIINIIMKASELIQEESARSAPKALRVIESQMGDLKSAAMLADRETTNKAHVKHKQSKNHTSKNGTATNELTLASTSTTEEEFTFMYEEEADPGK